MGRHQWQKDHGRLIDNTLHRGLRTQGRLHHADDMRQGCMLTNMLGLHPERTLDGIGTRNTFVTLSSPRGGFTVIILSST
jgi:hypothetical protein